MAGACKCGGDGGGSGAVPSPAEPGIVSSIPACMHSQNIKHKVGLKDRTIERFAGGGSDARLDLASGH